MRSILAAALITTAALTGCQKITTDVAEADKPEGSPEYTVEFNRNISPVEKANPDTSR